MEPGQPHEYTLEILADRASVKEVLKGVLHTLFFHRFFPALYPATHDVLDITLPYVTEGDVEALIEQRSASLKRQLDLMGNQHATSYVTKTGQAQVVVQFLEKKRKKGWFVAKADEETVWENWVINVKLTSAQSRRQMERSLQTTVLRIVAVAGRNRNHIPPITTNEANPFPYQILVNSR